MEPRDLPGAVDHARPASSRGHPRGDGCVTPPAEAMHRSRRSSRVAEAADAPCGRLRRTLQGRPAAPAARSRGAGPSCAGPASAPARRTSSRARTAVPRRSARVGRRGCRRTAPTAAGRHRARRRPTPHRPATGRDPAMWPAGMPSDRSRARGADPEFDVEPKLEPARQVVGRSPDDVLETDVPPAGVACRVHPAAGHLPEDHGAWVDACRPGDDPRWRAGSRRSATATRSR